MFRMLRLDWFCGAVLAAAALLGAGCGTLPPRHEASQPDSERGAQPVTDAQAEALARAHAHYAAAVIHRLNDEPAAALQEYYQAAIGDPDDEALVLEVSHRLLQGKQVDKALGRLTGAAA